VSHYLVAGAWLVAGAAGGFGVRRLSVWLARLENLEPGFRPWQVWGPVITTAALFGAFGWMFGATPLLLIKSLWVAVLVQVIFFDLEHRLILDRLMFPMMAAALLLSIWTPHLGWKQSLVAGLAAGFIFLAIALLGALAFRTEVMGFGDVKLALFIGLTLGLFATVQALLLGVVLAGVMSIALIAVRLKGLRDTIAYGPYLAAGAIWVLLIGGPH
jgi:prepilin signal peptidase PulO-like enzyme (type II secretory pathway)